MTNLKLCMFLHVICPHSVQDELGLIGYPDNVVPGGMGQQPAGHRETSYKLSLAISIAISQQCRQTILVSIASENVIECNSKSNSCRTWTKVSPKQYVLINSICVISWVILAKQLFAKLFTKLQVFIQSFWLAMLGTNLPSLTSSIKARPACFCREFCHSWEQSNITSSTTEVLCFRVTSPTI